MPDGKYHFHGIAATPSPQKLRQINITMPMPMSIRHSVVALLLGGTLLFSCKQKDDTPDPEPNPPASSNCADGSVCFKLNGTAISKPGSGYAFADTFSFVKYEEGAVQLSLDIFGNTAKAYTVGEQRLTGRARIYYFPEANKMYLAESGSLVVTEFTSDKKISGTFSGTAYRYDSGTNAFTMSDSLTVTEGSFKKIQLF